METVSFQCISDARPTHIITACEDTDTCPSCGAGYRAGLSECEYCRQAVKCVADGSWSPSIYGDGSGRALVEIV